MEVRNMKTLLITGASKGLGYECSKYFDGKYDVLPMKGKRACDFSNKEDLERFCEYLERIEVHKVIHCAGGGFGLKSDYPSWDDLQTLINVNLIAPVMINNAVVPNMIKQRSGNVVHVVSTAARFATATHSVGYSVAKAGSLAYVRILGRRLAKDNVVVTGIIPGTFVSKNNHWGKYMKEQPDWLAGFVNKVCPKGRMGKVEEVIPLIEFLLSDKASMMNGCGVPIDGGEGVTFP